MAKGSIRGIEFFTVSHTTTLGRRKTIKELPFQSAGAVAVDLGRAARKFAIQAIVFNTERSALVEALESDGPALLVHPAYGRVLVEISDTSTVTERTSATNVLDLSLKAVESAERPPQVPGLDTGAALLSASADVIASARASFSNANTGLQTAIADFVRASHIDVLDEVLDSLRDINGAISSVLAIPGGIAAQIDAISRELAAILDTPNRLFNAINGALEVLGQAARRILGPDGEEIDTSDTEAASLALPLRRGAPLRRAIGPMSQLGSDSPEPPDIDTPARQQQIAGRRAILRHFRAAGLAHLAAASAESGYDSAQDALAVRDQLAEALIAVADSEPDLDAALVNALRACAAATVGHLSEVAGRLPDIVDYTPADTLPVEVIAWQLYADAERGDEIVLRNRIAHPGFVPGKETIEVTAT